MIANVESKWVDGKLVFFSKTSGNTIATFDPDNDVLDVGTNLKLNGATVTTANAQADSVAADVATVVTDFNGLLAKLRTSGLLET